MIQFKSQQISENEFSWIAEGWGREVTKIANEKKPFNNWMHYAAGNIIRLRLIGFVGSRQHAYEAKNYRNKTVRLLADRLLIELPLLEYKGAEPMYKYVVKHEFDLRLLLPSTANQFTTDIQEIINFCKSQLPQI